MLVRLILRNELAIIFFCNVQTVLKKWMLTYTNVLMFDSVNPIDTTQFLLGWLLREVSNGDF